MTRSVILLDCDGCVVDLCSMVLRIAKNYGNTPSDVTEWKFENHLTETQCNAVHGVMKSAGFAYYLEPYPGAVECVHQLARDHDVVFVTSQWSKSPYWCYDRTRWLKRYFGDDVKVVFTKHKEYVGGDWLIEDSEANIARCLEAGSVKNARLVKRPYNKGTQTLEEIVEEVLGS